MKGFVLAPLIPLLFAAAARNPIAAYAWRQPTPATDTSSCADKIQPSDTIAAVLKISVRHQDTTAKLPAGFEQLLVDEFRSRFKPPRELPLIAMLGRACDTTGVCSSATPTVRVVAYAIAYLDGTMPIVNAISPTLNSELADSVRSALLSMGRDKMVPFFAADQPLPIKVIVEAETAPDSVPTVRQLFRAKLPHYTVQFREAWMSTGKLPHYSSRVIPDTLDFEFTIMPDGRVAARTIDVLHYHNQDFLEWAVKALPKMDFKPATLGGCPAPQWAKQRYVLSLPRSTPY